MSRELRARARARIETSESESTDEEGEQEGAAQIPQSSIQDLVQPADVQTFDQTFTDAGAELDIEGEFEPVAGDKQVIPRIAYVLSYQLVYNPEQERWEPDEGNESGGGAIESTTLEKTTDQSIPTNNTLTRVSFQQTAADSLSASDLSNNALVAPVDGEYRLSYTILSDNFDSGADLDTSVERAGTAVMEHQRTAPQVGSLAALTQAQSRVLVLSAGDSITLQIAATNTTDTTVIGRPKSTHMSLTQLS
jgi:hypothetical protein